MAPPKHITIPLQTQQFPLSASIGKISNDIEHAVGPIGIFTFSSQ